MKGVSVKFGGLTALSDIDYSITSRSLACIIGPNGAGKSTFLNVLTGTLRPSIGSVAFRGRDIGGLALHRISRLGIARKFQIPSVFPSLSVAENMDVARWGAAREPDETDVLEMVGLSARRDVKAADLSHGEKQWLEIGMAIAASPKLLLLDEPTAGMTSQETQATAALLHRLKRHTAIIAVEHDISFVRALDTDTLVLHQGRLFRRGPFSEIEADEAVRDVYLGRR
ncbi:ATP-binding cassette domain-containing protein [Bradyrhizobium uaiense]|nr:ATP-binding cassette domain-containing protein [Bradyrhizobium uaiense]